VKCLLRDHDQIEIGGVKILFNEEMTLQSIWPLPMKPNL
jgi:hypothetical protein